MLELIIPSKKLEVALYDFYGGMHWEQAIKACLELGPEWRLPYKAELEELYKVYYLNEIGNFKSGMYWCQNDENEAWSLNFSDGLKLISHDAYIRRFASYNARAVREI